MSFVSQPDMTKWDCTQIADQAIVADLADTAVANLRNLHPDAQQAILAAIKDLPVTHLDVEDIAHCALGQDEYAVEQDEITDEVVAAAQQILTRADILPLVDADSIVELISDANTPYRAMQAGVALLEQMPAERIPFQKIVEVALDHVDDDESFDDAVLSLLTTHRRTDDMRQLYDDAADPEDDSYLGALCREVIEAQSVAQPS